MSKLERWRDKLGIRASRAPPELLAALFSAAADGGLNSREGLRLLRDSAQRFDPELAEPLDRALLRLEVTTDRRRTLVREAEQTSDLVLRRLFAMLAEAEETGEDVGYRARQIFEELLADREAKVARRAEVYPITMIVLMVLFFMPAVLLLLVGPSYVLLLQVLRQG